MALFDAKPDTVSVYRPNFDIGYKVNYVYESKQSDSMYEPAWLDKRISTAYFLTATTRLSRWILQTITENRSLCSKDSYANSILPLLVNHYESVHIIDLRYFSADPLRISTSTA